MVSRDIGIDLSVYPIAAVHGAVTAVSDRCTSNISRQAGDRLVVTLTPLGAAITLEQIESAFLLALGDQVQQQIINERTKDIRVALVRAALAEALGGHQRKNTGETP